MTTAFKEALGNGYIEPAKLPNGEPFVRDGIQYYQATDGGISMLMGRFHTAADTLRKHDSLKITDEMLTTALKTMKDQLLTATAQINLDQNQALDNIRFALTTIDRLEARREYGLDTSQVYDIASVFFFTDQEDPAVCDSEVMRKNKLIWYRYPELYGFFLHMPLSRFVPLQELSNVDTLTYIKSQNQLELIDWTITRLKSAQFGLTPETTSIIESRLETLYALDGLTDALLSSTTASSPPGSGMNSAN